MNNYDFSTLNDKEFERLAKDLLNAKYSFGLQDFKRGKDKGVDLRCSTPENDNSLVVQVKHYSSSGFDQLKHVLIKQELDKVEKIRPDRYIVVTSLSLSASQKDTIKTALTPFVLSSNDVIGREDLNGLLSEFPDIENRNHKLWFSSVNILNRVLKNACEGRTKYLLQSIKEKISFFVTTQKFWEALRVLSEEKLLLIVGQPGVGKTTLAEILIFDRANKGYKIHKVETITEAEELMYPDETNQIFYFDDFLGANYLEIVNAQKTETQLTSFVERVKKTPNKYLVLTSRTVILNQAIERYEKIGRSKLSHRKFEIKLNDYSEYEKALILYNHLYFRQVNSELYESILENKFYRTIIGHTNYTPRLVEFFTDISRIEELSAVSYRLFILEKLERPDEIWKHSFNNQIDYFDRCLLLTLFTFINGATEDVLSSAYSARLKYERDEHNHKIVSSQFENSLRVLINGFISSTISDVSEPVRRYNLINPSLADFLMGFVANSYNEKRSIVSSVAYAQQLDRFRPEEKNIKLEDNLQLIIRSKIEKLLLSNKFVNPDSITATGLLILRKYCADIETDRLVLQILESMPIDKEWGSIISEIAIILDTVDRKSEIFQFVKENFDFIIGELAANENRFYRAIRIPTIFEKFGTDYVEYLKSKNGAGVILQMIERVLRSEVKGIEADANEFTDIDEVTRRFDEIDSLKSSMEWKLFPGGAPKFGISIDVDLDMDVFDWERRIAENLSEIALENHMLNDLRDDKNYVRAYQDKSDSKQSVDELFRK